LQPQKSHFFLNEVSFLGHKISRCGIEACNKKVDKITNWPKPTSASKVRSFLGLVRYMAVFLPKLAAHTCVLNPLTSKAAEKRFPVWMDAHQAAFQGIKDIVVSRECLTVIDQENPGDKKIFVMWDASKRCTGAVLSWGNSWKTARLVAFDSTPLRGAELHYPVYEKELLAILKALKKWQVDLLSSHIYVYTDHRTLENFDSQKELS
jgi:hypothetical protein